MKLKPHHTALLLASIAVATPAANAVTIVQWGESGGEEVVTGTGNVNGQNALGSSYNDTNPVNPSSGTSGYYVTDSGNRSTVFYGAQSAAFGGGVFTNSSPDYMQLVANVGVGPTFTTMTAWKAADGFLSSDPLLDSFSIEYQRRGNAATTSFLLEDSSGWWVTDQTFTDPDSNWFTASLDASSATWTAFTDFGVTGGAGAPDLSDIQSVGFFSSSTAPFNFAGVRVRHFEVTAVAVPEPSSTALLGLGGVALLLRRRRS